jgi:hypothetical protein
MKQLMDIADSGNIMPPKTTWFEPKLRSGLVIHSLDYSNSHGPRLHRRGPLYLSRARYFFGGIFLCMTKLFVILWK